MVDLSRQYAAIGGELEAALIETARSGLYTGGPTVEKFEAEVAQYIGTRHAVAVGSGTDALLISLMALGIGPGDEVITTPYSFFATAGSITRTGATPVLVDIDPHTYNIDVAKISPAITDRTKAIMPVHLYGQVADVTPMQKLACENNLPIVEDAAQAIGAERIADDGGGRAGTFGLLGAFSFYPTKNLGAMGEGGLVTTADDATADRVRQLRNHGQSAQYRHETVGGNFRMHALQAAVLGVKLRYLDEWIAGRQRVAATYSAKFTEAGLAGASVVLPVERAGRHIYHQYVIRIPSGAADRDAVLQHLRDKQIGCGIFYPVPFHLQPCFASLGHGAGDFPEAERAANETIALPIYPELTEAEITRVVDAVGEAVGK